MAETIAAISTAMQKGGIAVIRISGDDAFKIADKVFKGKIKTEDSESHRILYGFVYDGEEKIDECLCSVMRAPRSFTAENVVELSVHGGIIPAKRTLEAVIKAGARAAKAGEFTMRAFLNGRIDLSKAEAVADIIDSKTELARSTAVNQLSGKLSEGINEIRREILEIMSYISVSTDFPDEDADSLSGINIKLGLSLIKEKTENLIKNADKGIILREGAVCAICGKPNAGKSSLLNELAGEEKAIVTEIEGTTRDIIEEYINIFDIPIRLADTAGIREDADTVEKIGVKKAKDYIENADICLFVTDNGREFDENDAEILNLIKGKPHITVVNKSELEGKCVIPGEEDAIYISVKEKTGIDELKKKIYDLLLGSDFSEDAVMITNERHKEAAIMADSAIGEAIKALESGLTEDFAYINLESAVSHLGEITGMTVSDEVIGEVFSKFCIGK
ncbi:MAG: tRNA uridine-5-carboxymethylaminomethyl(34) synthesis GTPase MnmE [Clostridia bacterium]|nr:tRNA uridine-5-carboxymethylaminomethyl(34) synthesis GTPase MnmE [Clostridia bacterium]